MTAKKTDTLVGKIFKVRLWEVFYLGEFNKEKSYIKPSGDFIKEGDLFLILEAKKGFCKFLVLSGKHTGTVSWESDHYFNKHPFFKKVEIT